MNWSDYESKIFEYFRSAYHDAEIRKNVKVMGNYSKIQRQIDVLIEGYVAGKIFRTIVDGKFFSEKIDVKEVDSFIGMMNDVDAHAGILITQKGYSQAAIKRAYYDPLDIDVDILNFEDLKHLQGEIAIPYAGSNAILLHAPIGWIIDAERREGIIATLYQRGMTLEEAGKQRELMYINFWEKNSQAKSARELAMHQDEEIIREFPDAKITYPTTIKRDDAKTIIRRTEIQSYPALEYTGFVEFNDFIFFAVLLTPLELTKRNIRKLEYIMAKVLPMKIKITRKNNER
jgi:Restriction endonuclease